MESNEMKKEHSESPIQNSDLFDVEKNPSEETAFSNTADLEHVQSGERLSHLIVFICDGVLSFAAIYDDIRASRFIPVGDHEVPYLNFF
jgi:hypothetical protein